MAVLLLTLLCDHWYWTSFVDGACENEGRETEGQLNCAEYGVPAAAGVRNR